MNAVARRLTSAQRVQGISSHQSVDALVKHYARSAQYGRYGCRTAFLAFFEHTFDLTDLEEIAMDELFRCPCGSLMDVRETRKEPPRRRMYLACPECGLLAVHP